MRPKTEDTIMKSMETLLAEAVQRMTEDQRNKFIATKTTGMPIEGLVSLAESICGGTAVRESQRRITRNNGAQRDGFQESDPRAESDRILTEAIARRDPAFAAAIKETATAEQFSESQKKEYEFAKLFMSESDALKSVSTSL
jgi:hypothetical protein